MTGEVIKLGAERERRRNGYPIPRRKKSKPSFFAMYEYDDSIFSIKVFAHNDEDFRARVEAIRKTLSLPIADHVPKPKPA